MRDATTGGIFESFLDPPAFMGKLAAKAAAAVHPAAATAACLLLSFSDDHQLLVRLDPQ